MALRLLTFVLVLVGVVMVAVGVMYFTIKAGSLPSFFPGYVDASNRYSDVYAGAALAIGLAMFGLALVVPSPRRRR